PNISAYYCSFSYDGIAAENCCICINGNIIFHCRMPFNIGLVFMHVYCSQSNSLIYFNIVPNNTCLPYYNTGSVVNYKAAAYPRGRMDINSCTTVGVFGDKPWDYGDI